MEMKLKIQNMTHQELTEWLKESWIDIMKKKIKSQVNPDYDKVWSSMARKIHKWT